MNKKGLRILSKVALLAVVFGFFQPVACDKQGFDLADHVSYEFNWGGLAATGLYVLFFAAVVSIACTLILLICKGNICSKIATTLDFAALIASVSGGAIAFFTTTNRFPMDMIIDELNSGTYFILAGWIASFLLLLISSGIKINLENKE